MIIGLSFCFQQMINRIKDEFTFRFRRIAQRIFAIYSSMRRKRQFTYLRHTKKISSPSAIAPIKRRRYSITSRCRLRGSDDIQYARCAFRIIFCTRIGDNFHFLYYAGGKTLQNHRRIIAHHLVGLSVDVNLKVRFSIDSYLVLPIYCNERHLPKHFQHGIGLRIRIVTHTVNQTVYLTFHQRTSSYYFCRSQRLSCILSQNSTEFNHFVCIQHQFFLCWQLANNGCLQDICSWFCIM